MTKEELERIKQAYNSGLKIQIWFNGYWENFDITEYSMYSEPFSEHRRYRIVGSAYADIAEQRIAELEKENKRFEKENAELKKNLEGLKEFYEKEYFEISDKTAIERMHELERYETEITVDDTDSLDPNTWGETHEEIFVPKNLVLDMLKEIYAYIEFLKRKNAELEEENKRLNVELSNVIEVFQSSSSGDDLEMAECAREIMEILGISCYRQGKVKSRLSEAKEIIKKFINNPYFCKGGAFIEVSIKDFEQAEDFLTGEVEG